MPSLTEVIVTCLSYIAGFITTVVVADFIAGLLVDLERPDA